jgi:hypothetical protein
VPVTPDWDPAAPLPAAAAEVVPVAGDAEADDAAVEAVVPVVEHAAAAPCWRW